MSYFNKFPVLRYPVETYLSAVKDITLRMKFNDNVINNTLVYDLYRVKDTDTPELISYVVYGTTNYHWLVLMANNIIDPYIDWPMPDSIFNEWVEDKYKHLDTTTQQGELSPGADKTKYWVTESGIVVNQTDPNAVFPISHRIYEDLLNNQKRMIKLVKSEMLYTVVQQFEDLITR